MYISPYVAILFRRQEPTEIWELQYLDLIHYRASAIYRVILFRK